MKLRDYQEEMVDLTSISAKKHKRTILCAPTGSGKTVILSSMVSRALARGRTIFILCHRIEILHQIFGTLLKFGKTAHLVAPGHKYLRGQQLYVCMVETFRRRGLISEVDKDAIIFCDETHWGSFQEVVDRAPCVVIGLTATPKSSSGKELNEYFSDCIMPKSINWLIDNEYLVPGITYSIEQDVTKNVKIQGKDYSERLLLEEFKSPKIFLGVLEEYEKHAKGERAICYNLNVQHSLDVCQLFREAGYNAAHIDGTTENSLRRDYFESFRNGRIDILCNVGVATTGYDEPSIQCVIKNYATLQLTKDKQCEGRGARICEGKNHFKIIDLGKNYIRHGRFGFDKVDWLEVFNNPSEARRTRGKDREKECKLCGAVIEMTAGKCPYCNVEYSREEVEQIFYQKADTKEIKEYRIQQLPPHIRGKKPGHMSLDELREYSEILGYDKRWVGVQMMLKKQYKGYYKGKRP